LALAKKAPVSRVARKGGSLLTVRHYMAVLFLSACTIALSLWMMWADVWRDISMAELNYLMTPTLRSVKVMAAVAANPLPQRKATSSRAALAYANEGMRFRSAARTGKDGANAMLRASQNICFGVMYTPDVMLRMEHCLVSAGAGDAAAQTVVGGYYHRNASRPGDKVQAYAWLRTAANRSESWIAKQALLQLSLLVAEMDLKSVKKAESLSVKYIQHYAARR
jgi:hypothetical protein